MTRRMPGTSGGVGGPAAGVRGATGMSGAARTTTGSGTTGSGTKGSAGADPAQRPKGSPRRTPPKARTASKAKTAPRQRNAPRPPSARTPRVGAADRSDAPDLVAALAGYEAWVDARIPTVGAARADKHARMAADPFAFLRAGYARWAQRIAVLGAGAPGPHLLAVGDLHVENFGTWRDAEGRLVWGVNDLDEADRLPAAHDLVRLAASALLAERQGAARFPRAVVVGALLDGYAASAAAGGHPIVLDRPAPEPLGPLLPSSRSARWWTRLLALPPARQLAAQTRDLLLAALPDDAGPADLRTRVAGMGSRDHLRVVALADVAGAPVVREIKALAPPSTWWVSPPTVPDGAGPQGAELLRRGGPSADPELRIVDGWVIRRLAPWSDRIELNELHRRVDAVRLVRAMGAETANLHLLSSTPADLAALTAPAARRWIRSTAKKMLEDTVMDWLAWRDAQLRAARHER